MHYTKNTLKNGLRVITVPMKDSLTTTVRVFVAAGSEYETKRTNGISHFLEHMCFKGTTNRPKPIMIAKELDAIGAAYNAGTGREFTNYYAKAAARHFTTVLDIVADLYLNPVLDAGEIKKESGVIVEEINMYDDTPMERIDDVFMRCMYGDQPAGWDILGPRAVVKRLKRDDFLAYRGERYTPANTVVVMAGKMNEEKAHAAAERYFGGMPPKKSAAKVRTTDGQKRAKLLMQEKESDQSHLMVGFKGYTITDGRRWAANVLSAALGGGMSSRLFQRVREELGAAYYVGSMIDASVDRGHLAIAAGVNNEKLPIVLDAIFEECRKFADEPLSKAELEATKEHIVGSMMVHLETSDALARFYGFQEIMAGTMQTPEEKADAYRAISSADVQQVAAELFMNDRLNIALIGPKKNKEALQKRLRVR